MTFSTPQEEIAYLRGLLKSMWTFYSDTYLEGEKPDDIKRLRAFGAIDRPLRELGITGKKA
jgi:hypothetical protein